MSRRDQVLAILHDRSAEIEALGVTRLMLFGSVARGDDGPQSDVDVLVQFTGAPTFDGYMDLKFLLEDALHSRVDLVTTTGLREEIRDAVLAEALLVA